jgi:hypothetical protein
MPARRCGARVTGVRIRRLPGKHFLQEDCYEVIGEAVARLAASAAGPGAP